MIPLVPQSVQVVHTKNMMASIGVLDTGNDTSASTPQVGFLTPESEIADLSIISISEDETHLYLTDIFTFT